MFEVDIEPYLNQNIQNGNLVNCQGILDSIPDDEVQYFLKFLEQIGVKRIDGKPFVIKSDDGNDFNKKAYLKEKTIPAKNGLPKYTLYKSALSQDRFIEFQYNFLGIDINNFVRIDHNDIQYTIRHAIYGNILLNPARTHSIASKMQHIADGNAPKMNGFDAMITTFLFGYICRTPEIFKPDQTYDFRQAMCAAKTFVNPDRLDTQDTDSLRKLTIKKNLNWTGFTMPELRSHGHNIQSAPECWFCPQNSWNNCPVRNGQNEENGNFTINDIIEKYRETYKNLKNRANGIGTDVHGIIESVTFEYFVDAETYEITGPGTSTSRYGIPTGIYLPANIGPMAIFFSLNTAHLPNHSYYWDKSHAEAICKKYYNVARAANKKINAMPQFQELLAKDPRNKVKLNYASLIANMRISGKDRVYSVIVNQMHQYVPQIMDEIEMSFYESDDINDKTIKVLKFKTHRDSAWQGTCHIEQNKKHFEDFAKYTHQDTATFKRYLLETSGLKANQYLNQHYRTK